MHVPFLFIVPDTPATLVPLAASNFVTESGTVVQVAFKAVDRSGAPVASVPVRFGPANSVSPLRLPRMLMESPRVFSTLRDSLRGAELRGAASEFGSLRPRINPESSLAPRSTERIRADAMLNVPSSG